MEMSLWNCKDDISIPTFISLATSTFECWAKEIQDLHKIPGRFQMYTWIPWKRPYKNLVLLVLFNLTAPKKKRNERWDIVSSYISWTPKDYKCVQEITGRSTKIKRRPVVRLTLGESPSMSQPLPLDWNSSAGSLLKHHQSHGSWMIDGGMDDH